MRLLFILAALAFGIFLRTLLCSTHGCFGTTSKPLLFPNELNKTYPFAFKLFINNINKIPGTLDCKMTSLMPAITFLRLIVSWSLKT